MQNRLDIVRRRLIGIGCVSVLAAATASAQLTFTPSIVCSGSAYQVVEVKAEPTVGVTQEGVAVVAWSDYGRGVGGDILASRGLPSEGFGEVLRLNEFPVGDQPEWSWNHGMADLAVGPNGAVYTIWMERRPSPGQECTMSPRCDTDIYVARSFDGGVNWDPRNYEVSDDQLDSESSPAIAVSDSGRVHAVWISIEQRRLRYSHSDDGGQTWIPSRNVGTPPAEAEQWEPAIASMGSKVFLVWIERTTQGSRVYGTVSPNAGGLFRPPVRFDDGPDDVVRRNPEVTVRQDGLGYVVWEDFRNPLTAPDIYFSHLVPAFGQASPPVRVDSDASASAQILPQVAVDNQGRPAVVWQDYRNGLDDPDIYATRAAQSQPPFTFEADVQVNDDVATSAETRPSIAVSPVDGRLLVVWEHNRRDQGVDIRAASSRD